MKNTIFICLALLLVSCDNFLNVTPDHMDSLEDMYQTRQDAERSLYMCYNYVPYHNAVDRDPSLYAGLEITSTNLSIKGQAWYLPRSGNDVSNPYHNYWEGLNPNNSAIDLYQGISTCNIFLKNIHMVPDMDETERSRWIQEVKFLKIYYHYWLTRMYGPVPIKDVDLPVDATTEEVKVYRNTLDECFKYMITSLDEIIAAGALPDKIDNRASELGRITTAIVKAVKAEILITRASPLFNGTYKGVRDNRNIEIFSSHSPDEQLQFWRDAAEACKEAIDFYAATNNISELYVFDNSKLYKGISPRTKQILTLIASYNDPWNSDIIWANAASKNSANALQVGSIISAMGKYGDQSASANAYSGYFGVPITITEQFYTRNGLPIEEDNSWDYEGRKLLKQIDANQKYHLTAEKNEYTASCNMDREPRFYSSLLFDRSAWFGHVTTPSGQKFKSDDDENPMIIKHRAGEALCNQDIMKWNQTGYYPRKLFNFQTVINVNGGLAYKSYATPAMRLSGLFLYYAEALLESDAPRQEVLYWIDKVRERAGLKGVEETWSSIESKNPTKYQSKDGLREIIHQERLVELAFEGQRYWDLRRWMKATVELRKPVTGWNVIENLPETYYNEILIFQPEFVTRDYFWPIRLRELYADKNLVQNLGW